MADGRAIDPMPLAISHVDRELNAPDPQPVAGRQHRLVDPLVVDVGAVCAFQVDDLEPIVRGAETAVQARYEGDIEDEVGARRPSDGLDRTGLEAKRSLGALQNPHLRILTLSPARSQSSRR